MTWNNASQRQMVESCVLSHLSGFQFSRDWASRVLVSDACRAPVGEEMWAGLGGGYFLEEKERVGELARGYGPNKRTRRALEELIAEDKATSEIEPLLHSCPLPARDDGAKWYKTVLEHSYQSDATIAYQEALAGVLVTERSIEPNRKNLLVLDSSSVFFALSKGRSSCRYLNRLLRRFLVTELCASADLFYAWTKSSENWFADWRSRRCMPSSQSLARRRPQKDFDACLGYPGEGPAPVDTRVEYMSGSSDSDGEDFDQVRQDVERRLQTIGLQGKTIQRYETSLRAFNEYAIRQGWNCSHSEHAARDVYAASYILYRYDQGDTAPHWAGNLYSALKNRYSTYLYPLCKKVYRRISRGHHGKPALPLNLDMLYALLGYFSTEPEMIVCVLLSWMGALRACEVLRLCVEDVRFSEIIVQGTSEHRMTIALTDTKTRKLDVVVDDDQVLIPLLKLALAAVASNKSRRLQQRRRPVTSMVYGVWRRKIGECFTTLGYQEPDKSENSYCRRLRYSSHSFRRGKATFLWTVRHDVNYVAVHGRWASLSSLEVYLREGLALITTRGNKSTRGYIREGKIMLGLEIN